VNPDSDGFELTLDELFGLVAFVSERGHSVAFRILADAIVPGLLDLALIPREDA